MTCERCGETLVAGAFHVCDDRARWLRLRVAPATPASSSSSGIGRIVVGYRPGDRRVLENLELHGIEPRVVRKCFGGCGYPVLFYSGGVDAVSERDAEVICTVCKDEHYAELMAQL